MRKSDSSQIIYWFIITNSTFLLLEMIFYVVLCIIIMYGYNITIFGVLIFNIQTMLIISWGIFILNSIESNERDKRFFLFVVKTIVIFRFIMDFIACLIYLIGQIDPDSDFEIRITINKSKV